MVLLLSIKTDKKLSVEEINALLNYKLGLGLSNKKLQKTKVLELSVEEWQGYN